MKFTAKQIAEWFLNYNAMQIEEFGDGTERLSNLKLQKLLYYAQGCYLALKDQPLFDDDFLAWTHGPVIQCIYDEYKKYGPNGIPKPEKYENVLPKEVQDILVEVYEVFGKYSAWGLRNMTHQEDPWKNTPNSGVISKESIKKYFKEHYIENA